jgi:hypothetical protein
MAIFGVFFGCGSNLTRSTVRWPPLAKPLPQKACKVLVTCSQGNIKGKAMTVAKVVKLIRGQLRGNNLIRKAKKLPSGAFAFIFKSVKAKKAWQEQGTLKATFKDFAKTTFNLIVFSFLKRAINKVMSDKRLRAITS